MVVVRAMLIFERNIILRVCERHLHKKYLLNGNKTERKIREKTSLGKTKNKPFSGSTNQDLILEYAV
jgi:hypothetical protein